MLHGLMLESQHSRRPLHRRVHCPSTILLLQVHIVCWDAIEGREVEVSKVEQICEIISWGGDDRRPNPGCRGLIHVKSCVCESPFANARSVRPRGGGGRDELLRKVTVRVCELFCRVWQESHAAGAQRGTIDVGAVRKW